MFEAIIATAAGFLWLFLIFAPLERVFPIKDAQHVVRHGTYTDLLFFVGQDLIFAAVASSVLFFLMTPLSALESVLWVHTKFTALPLFLQIVIALVCGDVMDYWSHRLQHKIPLLWRFHAVHHSNEELDWLAAHREHPIGGIFNQFAINLPVVLLGMDFSALMGIIAFRSMWGAFLHSNINVNLGWLRYLVGDPLIHRWHHARHGEPCNYAHFEPWIDVVFGTYYCPDTQPEALGIEEYMPKSYPGMLFYPFLPRKQA